MLWKFILKQIVLFIYIEIIFYLYFYSINRIQVCIKREVREEILNPTPIKQTQIDLSRVQEEISTKTKYLLVRIAADNLNQIVYRFI